MEKPRRLYEPAEHAHVLHVSPTHTLENEREAEPAWMPSSTSSSTSVGRSSAHGLVPIIEPEVDIHSPEKAEAEALLKAASSAGSTRLAGRPAR